MTYIMGKPINVVANASAPEGDLLENFSFSESALEGRHLLEGPFAGNTIP